MDDMELTNYTTIISYIFIFYFLITMIIDLYLLIHMTLYGLYKKFISF